MGANSSVPANYSAAAYAVLIFDVVLTTVAVVGRTVSRKLMKATLSTDDTLTYIAYSTNIGLLLCGLLLTAFGALDLNDVSVQSKEEKRFVKAAYSSLATLYVITITFIKLSILFLYRRTFRMFDTWFRCAWWIVMVLVVLWTVTCITLLALQGANKMPKTGFSRLGISITGIFNAFSDILLIIIPAMIVSKMKLQKKQKIALISIFAIGGIASIVSIVRGTIFFINRAHQLNEAYSNYLDIVLTATEASAGVMCACLPLTKPVVIRITRWIQRLRGLSTDHQGWTTWSDTQKSTGKEKSRTIIRRDEYEVQLLPITTVAEMREGTMTGKLGRSMASCETTTPCESNTPRELSSPIAAQWEVQNTWGRGRI